MLRKKSSIPYWAVKMEDPRLRTASKVQSIYPLNSFPSAFPFRLGENLVYLLATKSPPSLEGSDWEQMFSQCIDADWKPSNLGLDDVQHTQTAWGAKTVIASPDPFTQKRVRLISGRNSPVFSYDTKDPLSLPPSRLGEMILGIWNERVSDVRSRFKDVRTVVLLKSKDFTTFSVFEEETLRYEASRYNWSFNKNKNLIGTDPKTKESCFTWQPHGSQFTIHAEVPNKRTRIRLKQKPEVKRDLILKASGFDRSWIEVVS